MAKNYRSTPGPSLRYDARGQLVKSKPKSRVLHFILCYLLPYLIINGLILLFVIQQPTIETTEPDTKDYQTASIEIKVDSLVPLKSLTATMDGAELPLEKSGSIWTADVTKNGTLTLNAKSINGMSKTTYVQINLLDDVGPTIDEESVNLGAGDLEFPVSDTQSGVHWDSIYGVDSLGNTVKPTDINNPSGRVTVSRAGDAITVYIRDLADNESSANFSVN